MATQLRLPVGDVGAAASPPDPALEAAETLERDGEIIVEYGDIQYRLTKGVSGRKVTVYFRKRTRYGFEGVPWRYLNPGWGLSARTFGFGPSDVVVAALTVLQPIFSGLPVWQLRCGTQMNRQFYPE